MYDASLLIIEDNPKNLKLLNMVLKAAGYRLRGAEDAEKGLALLREECPDMLLLDLQLPGMSGLDLLAIIRAEEAFATLPVVAITAYAMGEERDKAMAAGCHAYITKPISTRTLAADLAAILEAHEAKASAS